MFKTFTIIFSDKEFKTLKDMRNNSETMEINNLSFLSPIAVIDFEEGDETEIMKTTVSAFIDEIHKKFNILSIK